MMITRWPDAARAAAGRAQLEDLEGWGFPGSGHIDGAPAAKRIGGWVVAVLQLPILLTQNGDFVATRFLAAAPV